MAHSCRHCQKFILAEPRAKRDWVEVLEIELRSIIAASDECALFKWLLLQRPEASDEIRLKELIDKVVLRASLWLHFRPDTLVGQFVSWSWIDESIYGSPKRSLLKSLFIIAEVGEPAAHYHGARHIRKTVASPTDFDLSMKWLHECETTHSLCNIPPQHILPLRLVEIHWEEAGHEPTLQLTRTAGEMPYAALSYCWGDSTVLRGTKLNHHTRQGWSEDIPFCRLPNTLQDAIVTTWKLGLRFIWIDSLCIVQDDDLEKITEIAKMPHIYGGASVTINAARAKSSDEGFLHDVQVPSSTASIFKMAYACPKGKIGTILLFDDPVPQLREPVNSRGWTLQEYLLSPRVLTYGVHGLRFSCRTEELFDTDRVAEGALSAGNNKKLASLREFPTNPILAMARWSLILEEYSRRSLSNFEDRLLAISGIANIYSRILRDEYLAGIWYHDLPAGLMWERTHLPLQKLRRNQAPSWSWASFDGPVENFKRSCPVDPTFCVLSHDIQLVDPQAPFGAVRSGHLNIRGLLRKVLWNGIDLFPIERTNTDEYLALVTEDTLIEMEHSSSLSEVWCLQVHHFDASTHRGPSGLIITREGEQTFRRLGVFAFDDRVLDASEKNAIFHSRFNLQQREWSASCEMRELVLI